MTPHETHVSNLAEYTRLAGIRQLAEDALLTAKRAFDEADGALTKQKAAVARSEAAWKKATGGWEDGDSDPLADKKRGWPKGKPRKPKPAELVRDGVPLEAGESKRFENASDPAEVEGAAV